MTRKQKIILAAVLAMSGAGGLALASPEPASAPKASRSCFFTDQVNGWREAGDRTVYLNVSAHDVYRLDLFGPCRDVDTSLRLGLETRGGGNSICDGLDVTLVTESPIGPMRCPVTKVTKLTPAEVAALPKKSRP